MEAKVFEKPITNSILEGMPEYEGKTITRVDRARLALDMEKVDGNAGIVFKFLDNLKERHPSDIQVAGQIRNCTGDKITLVDQHVWRGSPIIIATPVIENGQVGTFFHTGASNDPKARAALVYRAKNAQGVESDWMFSWSVPEKPTNKAYTEIEEPGHFVGPVWRVVELKLLAGGPTSVAINRGLAAMVGIGAGNKPKYGAHIRLAELPAPPPRCLNDE